MRTRIVRLGLSSGGSGKCEAQNGFAKLAEGIGSPGRQSRTGRHFDKTRAFLAIRFRGSE